MTDQDRTLWAAAQDDYTKALKIAVRAWDAADPLLIDVTPEALQAAAATILIHITKLRNETHLTVRVPAQAAVSSDAPNTSHAPAAGIPTCPQCGGEMYDNRQKKASGEFKPTSADFTCKDKSCKNEKGFRSGVWLPKDGQVAKKKAEGAKAGVAAGRNFNEKPGPLVDEEDFSDLPF